MGHIDESLMRFLVRPRKGPVRRLERRGTTKPGDVVAITHIARSGEASFLGLTK